MLVVATQLQVRLSTKPHGPFLSCRFRVIWWMVLALGERQHDTTKGYRWVTALAKLI